MNLVAFTISMFVMYFGFKAAKSDYLTYKIPNKINAIVAILFFTQAIYRYSPNVWISYFVIVALHFGISLWFPDKFGMGDSKMIAAFGLGFSSVESLFVWLYLAYILGALHGFWHKSRSKPTRIPFGVSIYAAWVAIYMGEWAHVAMDYSW